MKKILLFCFVFFFASFLHGQGCLPEGITFTTQEQIDNFQTDYPGCTVIEGDVKINGLDIFNITNLDGLIGLDTIKGNLTIRFNWNLSNLSGLDSLEAILGDFSININQILTDITALNHLKSIGGEFSIFENIGLNSLSGLENLTYIGDNLIIYNNRLVNLIGLEGLTTIGGDLKIVHCSVLANLEGLESLLSLKGGIIIGGEDYVEGNPSLISLKGLENIDADSIQFLYIINNFILSTCNIQSICDYLNLPDGSAQIHDNYSGCNSREEVEAACLIGIKNIIQENKFSIFPNPSSSRFTIQFNLEKEEQVKLVVLNNLGQTVSTLAKERLSAGEHEFNWNAKGMPAGVYFYQIQIGNQAGTGKMVVVR